MASRRIRTRRHGTRYDPHGRPDPSPDTFHLAHIHQPVVPSVRVCGYSRLQQQGRVIPEHMLGIQNGLSHVIQRERRIGRDNVGRAGTASDPF
jgi:hypothetical protein